MSTSVATPTDVTEDEQSGKYLTFYLAEEEYGIEILRVREIIGMMEITSVPQTPEYIRGMLNLRGKVIPVVDLRLKFGMEPTEQTEETCIIVVETEEAERGIIVDKVSEVLAIPADATEPPPYFGEEVDTSYIRGIGQSEGRVQMLLDIDRALSQSGVVELPTTAAVAAEAARTA